MIDQTDLAILKALSNDSRIKIKALSKEVALSEPSVKTRIEKMIDNGIITSFSIEIDYSKLGYTIPLYIQISDLTITNRHFLKIVEKLPEITAISSVTGETNYLLKAQVQTVKDMETLLSILIQYGKVATSIVLEEKNAGKLIDTL
ncbi:Lrp/AsnC family transcriptional regulator [Enterococcus sp. 22-H-5-01]|uniref:Lrp/AsnC family transcriptional regulator n=1 Tax=Enterococcus sp. 22-H-5-01 TaxID=3418555 RepID=UPI003D057977